MRLRRGWCGCVFGLALLPGIAGAGDLAAAEPASAAYRVQARLTPHLPQPSAEPYRIRARLQPQALRPDTRGSVLKAQLLAAGEPLCRPPGFLFGDSFESPVSP